MKRLKGWKLFAEIKEMKEKGFNKSQTSRNLLIDFETVSNYWNMTPDEYAKLLKKRKSRVKKLWIVNTFLHSFYSVICDSLYSTGVI